MAKPRSLIDRDHQLVFSSATSTPLRHSTDIYPGCIHTTVDEEMKRQRIRVRRYNRCASRLVSFLRLTASISLLGLLETKSDCASSLPLGGSKSSEFNGLFAGPDGLSTLLYSGASYLRLLKEIGCSVWDFIDATHLVARFPKSTAITMRWARICVRFFLI